MRLVLFVLVPGVHLLDLAGPAQVFSTAADLGLPYRLAYVGEQERVLSAQGLPLTVGTAWPALARDDLVVVPGWRTGGSVRKVRLGSAGRARLVGHRDAGGTVASICAGAFVLGRAGLLDGRRCTTHHELQDQLGRDFPAAVVERDVLYVVDDRVATSAGIASGTDLALHLLAAHHGPAAAARAARSMVVYSRRNGDEQQLSAMLRYRSHLSDVAHRAQDIIDARFDQQVALGELANNVGVSTRTLTRQFTEATGMTPLRYQQLLRLERAEHLIGTGTKVEVAARAVGFADPRMLRRLRSRARPLTGIAGPA
jgi:transcriptional regulator GlxA family with amidase domain